MVIPSLAKSLITGRSFPTISGYNDRGRFVEQHCFGFHGQGFGDCNPLLLPPVKWLGVALWISPNLGSTEYLTTSYVGRIGKSQDGICQICFVRE